MARYEKTIAGNDYVFSIIIPTTFTSVFDILTVPQQQLILPSSQQHNLIDGYVVSYAGPWEVSRTHIGAGIETVLVNEKYLSPVEAWPMLVTIRASSPLAATVRIFVAG